MFMNTNIAALRAAYPTATIKVSGKTVNGELVFAASVMNGDTVLSEVELNEKLTDGIDATLDFALLLAGFSVADKPVSEPETVHSNEDAHSEVLPAEGANETPVTEETKIADEQPKKRRGRKPKVVVETHAEKGDDEPEQEVTPIAESDTGDTNSEVPEPVPEATPNGEVSGANTESEPNGVVPEQNETDAGADEPTGDTLLGEMTMDRAKDTVATLRPNASVGNNKRLSTEIVGKKLGALTKLHIRLIAKGGTGGKPSPFTDETVAAAIFLRKNED